MASQQIRILVPSRLDQIHVVGRLVDGAARTAGLDLREAHEVRLAVVEVVTNAVEHAYHREPGHELEVRVASDDEELVIEVWDAGACVDPARLERPLPPALEGADPSSLPEHGLGLFFIHEIMDEVSYTSRDGRNCMRLVRRLGAEKTLP